MPSLVDKLCFSTLVCPDWTLPQMASAAADAGIAGIDFRGIGPELDITVLPDFTDDLATTLTLLESRGISMPCLNTSVTLLEFDAAAWSRSLEEYARYARLARRTGTRMLRVFGGSIPADTSYAAALENVRVHLRELVQINGRINGGTDCIPVLESHDNFRTADQVLAVVDAVPARSAAILWDIEHTYRAGECPADTVRLLGSRIKHVHVKDVLIKNGAVVCSTLLGQGNLPVAQAMRCLAQHGYDGWLSLETEKRWRPDAPAPESSVPQFAAFTRRTLEALQT